MQSVQSKQLVVFGALLLLSIVVAVGPGRHLLNFAYETGDQNYIVLMPILCGMLIYRDRDAIFSNLSHGRTVAATAGFIAGLLLIGVGWFLPSASEIQMAVTALGLVAFWTAAFIYCFGTRSARAALFPIGMLLWIIPIPAAWLAAMTSFLQVGSTELVAVLFQLTRTPVLRDGFVFQLPGQAIEVAKECSGIRSSLALIILTLVIAHESLRGNVRRTVLLASTIPLVILKNGIRIVSLTLLAIHVDPSFLTGPLHHQGGIVFFLIGLAILLPILGLLRLGDKQLRAEAGLQKEVAAGT